MTDKEKIRELSRKHQGTMTDAQYLQMMYALEEIIEWKDREILNKVKKYFKKLYPLSFEERFKEFEKLMKE